MSENQKNKTKEWISFRVKPGEYDIIYSHFSKTTNRKLSEYCRNVLLFKPVTIKYRNQSADEFLLEAIQIKKELNAIGNNYNQSIKKLHTLTHDVEVRRWLLENDLIQNQVQEKINQIYSKMDQIHRQWLSA